MKTVLILGANSGIAQAVAKKFSKESYKLILAARDTSETTNWSKELSDVTIKPFDALDFQSHQTFYDGLDTKPDAVVLCFGYLPEQKRAETDFTLAHKAIDINYTGAVSILEIIAADMESRKSGTIIGISSVAGDRGRKKNYIYGSAKAAFTQYLSGLRQRLLASGVHVATVIPGFVYTKMTVGMDLPPSMTAQPDEVANDIYKAYKKKTNVVYSRPKWALIMFIIRHIPEFIFKKMDI